MLQLEFFIASLVKIINGTHKLRGNFSVRNCKRESNGNATYKCSNSEDNEWKIPSVTDTARKSI